MEIWGTPVLAEVEDIVRDLRDVLQSNGSYLLKDVIRQSTTGLMVTCISHKDGQETKPSCGISVVDQIRNGKLIPAGTVHCFTCDYAEDFATFVSNCFGYNDGGMFGYKWVTQNYVNLAVEHRKPLHVNTDRGSQVKQKLTYITEEELSKYRFTHPYMYHRKLTDKVINYFDIGFDRDTNSLTFPVADKEGNILFVQRRRVDNKFYTFPEGDLSGQTLFGIDKIYKNLNWITEVVVTESIIDTLTCWVHRKPAVAQFRALPTPKQIQLLKELPVRRIIDGLDNDDAGRKGAKKLKEGLGLSKLFYRLHLPDGVKDLNEAPEEFFDSWSAQLF